MYNTDNVIKESLEQLKVFNHKKRETYVNKLIDYYMGIIHPTI